jgi:hypothetical protein
LPEDPWLSDMNKRGGVEQKINNAIEAVRSAKRVCLCKDCKGDKEVDGKPCRKCKETGFFTAGAKALWGS